MTRGRGAPWPLRLFVGAMLHAPLASRDGHRQGLVLPAREVIRWLHPNRWRNQASRWYQFPEALRRLDQLRVYIPRLGRVRLVAVNVIPTTPDEYVAFELLTPSSASRGARLDWTTLTDYGRRSAPLYRGYLTARTVIDHTARHGNPVTAQIPAPIRDTEGRPIRGKGGRILRSPNHGTEPHPIIGMVPTFDADQLARMAGYQPNRQARRRAIETFQKIAKDGHIDLQHTRGRWRILGPATPPDTTQEQSKPRPNQ